MRRDWIIIALMVFFALAVIALIVGEFFEGEEPVANSGSDSVGSSVEVPVDVNDNESSFDNVASVGGGTGGGDSGGGAGSSVPVVYGDSIPDIAANPCGYYFEGYGICDGTCPDGECTQDGGSCYCKKS